MSNPDGETPTEEDILFGGGPASPVSVPNRALQQDPDEDSWAPLPSAPEDPLSAPRVEAAPAGTSGPIMDQGAPLPPEKPPDPEPRPAVRIRPTRQTAVVPAQVSGPRRRSPRPWAAIAPSIVGLAGLGTGAVMFLHFDNPPLAGVASLLGVIGALFTRVLLREPR